MKIIIIGVGTVGSSICARLAGEGHDITVIDTDYEALSEVSNAYDVFGVLGNGAEISVLRKAGAENADLLIAVTSGDELNILCCAAARKLGADHTIARVRNPEYNELMQLMKHEMNLSLTINPEYAVAKELYRMLRFPAAAKLDTFCHGRVEVAELTVTEDSALCGSTLNDLRSRLNTRFLVCSVLRDGEVHIPSGYFTLNAGDIICVTAPDEEITKFFKAIGAYKDPVKNVLIIGGGRTTYYLESLMQKSKMRSTVIEPDREKCNELAEDFPCTVICDEGTKQELLLEEGLEKTDAFLALTDSDEGNAIVSIYAKTKNTKKIITRINSMGYAELFKSMKLESIVSPQTSTAAMILRYVRSMDNAKGFEIESLHKFMQDKVEALEFIIKDNIDGITNIPLKDLKLRLGILIACIVHGDKVIIPGGNDIISTGDTVIVIATEGRMKDLKDILK